MACLENWVNSNTLGNFRLDGIHQSVRSRALTALQLNYARCLSNVFGDVAAIFRLRSFPSKPPTNVQPLCVRLARFHLNARKKRRVGGSFAGIFNGETECKRTSRNVNLATRDVLRGKEESICLGALSVSVKRVYPVRAEFHR